MMGGDRRVPKNVAALKGVLSNNSKDEAETQMLKNDKKAEHSFKKTIHMVGFRYLEYCITAPLLFLAVMCLLTVDAPAW